MSSFASIIQKLLEILQEFLNIRAAMNLLLILDHLSFNLLQLSSYIISSTYRLSKRTRHMTLIWILIYQLDTLHLAELIQHLPSTLSGDDNIVVRHLVTAEETHDFSLDFIWSIFFLFFAILCFFLKNSLVCFCTLLFYFNFYLAVLFPTFFSLSLSLYLFAQMRKTILHNIQLHKNLLVKWFFREQFSPRRYCQYLSKTPVCSRQIAARLLRCTCGGEKNLHLGQQYKKFVWRKKKE